jgi:hypothetical protein
MSGRSGQAYLAAAVLALALALSVQAILGGAFGALAGDERASTAAASEGEEGPTPGNTLISSQSYHNSGKLIEVTPEGEVVWEYAPEGSRIFDAEVLDNGDILVAVATRLPAEECPDRELVVEPGACVYNRIERIEYGSKDVAWNHTWYDAYITHHEVHDVDMLDNGEVAVVDMGNDRAFTVNESGAITWEWDADERIAPGTDFYQQYGGDPNPGEEADWTHINDIDQLENGNFQLSIRNFDSVIEIDPESKEVVEVYGRPGNHSLLYEQHNPHQLADGETILVADSENQRVIEVDAEGNIGWKFGGKAVLTWPRDADRLPSGNTLITDSVNDRVIEVAPNGTIVWQYQGVALPYSADRVGVPEERGGPVVGDRAESRFEDAPIVGTLTEYVSFAKFVLPGWVGVPELVNASALLFCGLWLVVEVGRRRYRSA